MTAADSRPGREETDLRSLWLLAYLVLEAAYVPSRGYYSRAGVIGIALAAGLLSIPNRGTWGQSGEAGVRRIPFRLSLPSPELVLRAILLAWALAAPFVQQGMYGVHTWPALACRVTESALSLLAISYLLGDRVEGTWLARWRLPLVFLLAGLSRVFLLLEAPWPRIDVFYVIQGSAEALWHGINPYTITYQPTNAAYAVTGSYPPAALYVTSIFWLLTHDIRTAYVAAELGAAFLIWKLASAEPHRDRRWPEMLALAVLFRPLALFMLEQAWVDGLLIFWLALFAWLAARMRWRAAAIALGLLVGSKQTALVSLPFLVRLRRWRGSDLLLVLGTVVATVLPLLAWGPSSLLDQVVRVHLRTGLRLDALNLMTVFYNALGHALPGAVFLGWWLLVTIVLLLRQRPGLAPALATAAACNLWFYLMARQAFFNYYYGVGFFLLLAAAVPVPGPSSSLHDPV